MKKMYKNYIEIVKWFQLEKQRACFQSYSPFLYVIDPSDRRATNSYYFINIIKKQ